MEKSADAFRTISEVAELLDTPAHVLRFWESRFPQIKPVKRAGGRRYYRPSDVALLVGIRRLLHDEGMTIRGVQKILREQGVRHVSGLTEQPFSDADVLEAEAVELGKAQDVEAGYADAKPLGNDDPSPDDPGLDALISRTIKAAAGEPLDPAAFVAGSRSTDAPPDRKAAGSDTALQQGAGHAGETAPQGASASDSTAGVAPVPVPATPEQMPLFADPASAAPPRRIEDVDAEPLPNRLRRLRRKQMAPRRTQLGAIVTRLVRLRDKLAGSPPTLRS